MLSHKENLLNIDVNVSVLPYPYSGKIDHPISHKPDGSTVCASRSYSINAERVELAFQV